MARKWRLLNGWWGWSEGGEPEPASTDYAAQQAKAAVAAAMPHRRSMADDIRALTGGGRKQQPDAGTDEEMKVSIGQAPRAGKGHFDTAPDTDAKLEKYVYRPVAQRGSSLFSKRSQGSMEVDEKTGEKAYKPIDDVDLEESRRTFNHTMFHDPK